jgi:small subunit ribosomal protein S21
MIKVNVKNGNIDKALRFLKRKVRNTKQTNELRERKKYAKPSQVRREAKSKAIYIEQKRIKDEDI